MRRSILKKIKTTRSVGRTIRKARSKGTRDARRSNKGGKKYHKKRMKIQGGGAWCGARPQARPRRVRSRPDNPVCDECRVDHGIDADGSCTRCGKVVITKGQTETADDVHFGVTVKHTITAEGIPEIIEVRYSSPNFSGLLADEQKMIQVLIEGSLLGKAKSNLV